MKINLSNFETSDVSLFDVSIVQRDVGGGKTEKEDIDCLEEYPTAKSLIISGLNQECFEYLIKHYGSQFEAISFWKNKPDGHTVLWPGADPGTARRRQKAG